jgi:hypothetical protein
VRSSLPALEHRKINCYNSLLLHPKAASYP